MDGLRSDSDESVRTKPPSGGQDKNLNLIGGDYMDVKTYKLDLKDVDPKVAALTVALRQLQEALETTGYTKEQANGIVDLVIGAVGTK